MVCLAKLFANRCEAGVRLQEHARPCFLVLMMEDPQSFDGTQSPGADEAREAAVKTLLPRVSHRLLLAARGCEPTLAPLVSDGLLDVSIRRDEQRFREGDGGAYPLLEVFGGWHELAGVVPLS